MKKLMFIAAAMACIGLNAEITSANVVGYQEKDVAGYTLATPTFEAIGETAYPIDNYVVKNSANTQTKIQVLDAQGQTTGTYYWFNAEGEWPAGWFDAGGTVPAGISLKPGEGVLFYTTQSNVKTQTSGQVGGEVTRDLAGYAILGNPSPVAVAIDNVTVQNSANTQTKIQVLDAQGQTTGTYYWFNAEGEWPAGWFDAGGTVPAGITLQPGDSVLFYTTQSGVTVKFPAAL